MLKELKATVVLEKLLKTDKRFTLLVGSSRSSKTWSMLQWIIIYCAQNKDEGKWISVVRRSFPSLRRTVYRDFIELLGDLGLYSENIHNKSEHVINLWGNYVEFFSLNDSQKVRGAKRDILFLNEANEIPYEPANQLFLRTYGRVFMDENPSNIWHWSYKMMNNKDCDYIHSTYKDNPFLTNATITQIESYKDTDINMWKVYGLGEPGFATTTIYSTYGYFNIDDIKDIYDDFCYGLDVGYSHQMALIRTYFKDDTCWVEEVIYKSGLTSADLIKEMNSIGIEKTKDIWVDAASPAMIEDLKRAGYNAKGADKAVKEGIDLIKSKKLFLNNESTNLIDEIRRYSWKSKDETIIYEPVKQFDDGIDAMRYSIYNYYKHSGVKDWSMLFG